MFVFVYTEVILYLTVYFYRNSEIFFFLSDEEDVREKLMQTRFKSNYY